MNIGELAGLLSHLSGLKEQIAEVQEKLAEEIVESSGYNGMIRVAADGCQNIRELYLNPDLLDPGKVREIERALLAVVNTALKRSRELAKEEIRKILGNLGLYGALGMDDLAGLLMGNDRT